LKTGAGFQQVDENRPTLDCKLYNRWVMSYWGTSLGTYGEHDGNTGKKKFHPHPSPPQKGKMNILLGVCSVVSLGACIFYS